MAKTTTGLALSQIRWVLIQRTPHGAIYGRVPDDLRVIETKESHDGAEWLHVSASRASGIPSWADMREVKDAFCGKEMEAYIILPPENRYVNDNSRVLHIWCPLAGPLLPDFRRWGPLIRGGEGWTL